MENAYAQALLELVGKGTKPGEAVRMMKRSLEERGRAALLPKIARAFARIGHRQEATNKLTLTVAHSKDFKHVLKEVENILAQQNISDVELCEEVDEGLIGGWRLEGRGVLVDTSWKKSLLSIYNRSTT